VGLKQHFQAPVKCDLSPQKEQTCTLCLSVYKHFLLASPWVFQVQHIDCDDLGTMILLLTDWANKGQLSLNDVEVQEMKVWPFLVQMRHTVVEGSLPVPLQKGGCLFWEEDLSSKGAESLGV
jgi:hypothetical protein